MALRGVWLMSSRGLRIGLVVLSLVAAIGVGGFYAGLFDNAVARNIYARGQDNLAIDGYDTVAYFIEGRAVMGDESFHQVWEGAKWRFISAENRDLFISDPVRYAPAYGSYCAMGMADGKLSEGNAEAWSIVNGKLYLKYNDDTRQVWHVDVHANIESAESNWVQFDKVF